MAGTKGKRKKVGRPKKRRVRTQHPGVKIKQIARTGTWVARYIDPDTGREKQESFTVLGKTTHEARRDWAIAKSKKLKARKANDSAGLPTPTRTGLEDAVKDYLQGLTRKRPKTIKLYTQALGHMTTWARKAGVSHVQEIGRAQLFDLTKHLHGLKARENVKGDGVGRKARQTGKRPLAPATINQFIRGIRTFLRHCRLADLTDLSSDDIRERLKFADKDGGGVQFLRTHEIRALIEACQRHDDASYQRPGQGEKPYPAILPFTLTVLLGGFRFSEAAGLKWSDVDLTDGEITLDKSATKTRRGRIVKLRETPALWALLERMAMARGSKAHVFGPMRRDLAEACRRRLQKRFGAPSFTWHDLRRTAGTYLTCAPSIYGAASAFLSAKRLGHSVTVAERHYVGAVDVSSEARTLEAAMRIDDLLPAHEQSPPAMIS